MTLPGGSIAPMPRGMLPLLVAVAIAAELPTARLGIESGIISQSDTILNQAAAVFWLAMLGSVFAAMAAVHIRRSSLAFLILVQRRERATVALIGVRVGAVIAIVHLIATVFLVIYARSLGLQGMPPLVVLVQLIALLAAFCVLGAALGWWIENFLAVPAALAVSYALFLPVVRIPGLEFPPSFVSLASVVASSWFLVSAMAWGLAAVAVLGVTGGASRVSGYLVALLAAAGLFAADTLMPAGGAEARNTAPLACIGELPRVCAYPERRAWLKGTRDNLVRLDGRLLEIAPERPVVREWTEGSGDRKWGRVNLNVADPGKRRYLSEQVAGIVLTCEVPVAQDSALTELLYFRAFEENKTRQPRDHLGRPTSPKDLEVKALRGIETCRK